MVHGGKYYVSEVTNISKFIFHQIDTRYIVLSTLYIIIIQLLYMLHIILIIITFQTDRSDRA